LDATDNVKSPVGGGGGGGGGGYTYIDLNVNAALVDDTTFLDVALYKVAVTDCGYILFSLFLSTNLIGITNDLDDPS